MIGTIIRTQINGIIKKLVEKITQLKLEIIIANGKNQ